MRSVMRPWVGEVLGLFGATLTVGIYASAQNLSRSAA